MSYSGGYKSSPRGGRGYVRGYRGSSRGGGEGGSWRGGGRGYSGSSRSRGSRFSSSGGKWERDSGSYESRSRYNSGGGDRYSSHGREEESSYPRYRNEDSISSYSSREHSHRASSPERKRMRTEYSPASSMHRSHDYGEGLDYSSPRSYGGGYESKRMSSYVAGDERRNLFRDERERIRSDDFHFRKPMSMSARHSTPRGSTYRGRSFSRGLRSGFRQTDSYRGSAGFLKKRAIMESYGVRRRIAPGGKTQEYLRRLKLYRLQRLKKLRERAENEESDRDDEEVVEEEEIEEEVTDDEDGEGENREDEEKEKKDGEDEEEEGEEKKEEQLKKTKKVKKIVKVIKKIKRKVVKAKEEDTEKTGEDEEGKDIHVTVKQDTEGRDVDGPVRKNFLGQPFMKLECPHCLTNHTTFQEYGLHLYDSKHHSAVMHATALVRKAVSRLRMEQRAEQRVIDEECKLKNMNMRTFFCMVCKLNYRSLKSEHVRSDKHKQIMNSLNPYCKVCRLSCNTPMMYENHICSLNHLKRKYYYDKKHSESQEGNEIDMDNYMVLDQVGSGEEESESESSDKGDKEKEEKGEGEEAGEGDEKVVKEKIPKKKKKQINLGSEYCKKIQIYFCELCKSFLPRIDDQEQALAVHCRGSNHLRWYVQKKDVLALRKRAERIHRMREEMRKAVKKEADKDEEPMDVDASEDQNKSQPDVKKENSTKEGNEDMETGMDDKVWTDVSKDLGDLLAETDGDLLAETDERGNKSSDDEDDSRAAGRRYDRFKHSEKGKAGKVDSSETKSDENLAKAEIVNGEDEKDA